MEEVHIIRLAHGPYNSPVWPVKKPDATWTRTVDYRELNNVTPRCTLQYHITELMETLAVTLGAYRFLLDLTNAFFSTDIAQKARISLLHVGGPAVDSHCPPARILDSPTCVMVW